MSLALVLAAPLYGTAALAQDPSRVAPYEVELLGPVREVWISVPGAGEVHLAGALGAGESLRLVVPLPRPANGLAVEPLPGENPNAGAGSVRFLGPRESGVQARLAALSPGLRARALPSAPAGRVRAAPSALWLLAASFALALGARGRRILVAASLGVGALAVVLAAAAAHAAGADVVSVLDGEEGSELWRRARAARGALPFSSNADAIALVSEPADAPLTVRLPLAAGARGAVESARALLCELSVETWPDGSLARGQNQVAPLELCWLRENGRWTARGPWPLGAPLPGEIEGPAPPGWLASGLPQGVTILLGRAEPASGLKGETAEEWVRIAWP